MMKAVAVLLLGCLGLTVASAEYVITAPKRMRLGFDYTLGVSFCNATGIVDLSAEIWDIHYYNYYEPEYNDTLVVEHHRSFSTNSNGMVENWILQIPRTLNQLPWQRRYQLNVRASGALNFLHQGILSISNKNLSIFIQSDKAMYKPGDLVQFRTFAVHADLTPFHEPMDIEVYDNDYNKIAEWIGETSPSGMVSKEIQLSDQPVLGSHWKISVTTGGNSQTKYFEVAEYVLPKFEVTISYPRPYLLVYDTEARIIVDAKYTYGRGVRGNGTVSIHPEPGYYSRCYMTQEEADRYSYYGTTYAVCRINTYQVEMNSDGHAEIVIPMLELLQLIPPPACAEMPCTVQDLANKRFEISANVTERATGLMLGDESEIKVESQSMSISFMSMTPGSYKPGLTFRGYIQLKNPDNSVPSIEQLTMAGEEKVVEVKVTQQCPPDYSYNYYGPVGPSGPSGPSVESRPGPSGESVGTPGVLAPAPATGQPGLAEHWGVITTPPPTTTTESMECQEISTIQSHPVSPSGIVIFETNPDTDHNSLLIEATFVTNYNETLMTSKSVSKFETRDEVSLQISTTLSEGVVRPGMVVTFTVTTTEEIEDFYYGVMGKGNMVILQHVRDGTRGMEHTFDLSITDELAQLLAPSANIIVWYITSNEEMIADSAGFTVDGAMVNDVTVEFSLEETRPGNLVNLTVSAYEGSTVGILAVDQSVLLLASGNDITESMVMNELNMYSTGINSYSSFYGMIPRIRKKRDVYFCFWCYPVYGSSTDVQDLFSTADLFVFTSAYMHQAENYYYYPSYRGGLGERGQAGPPGPAGPAGPSGPSGMPGAIADSAPTSSGQQYEEVSEMRSDFPETWIWQEAVVGPDGRVVITEEVPDTITSWVATTFALSDEKGLGVAPDPAKVTVFKPFFVSLTLPYSLTRTEEFAMKTTVFNYKNTTQQVLVTLEKSTDFKVLYKNEPVFQTVTQTIEIPPDDSVTVVFWIIPVTIGSIPIIVKAQSYEASDGLKRYIVVEPEGTAEEYCDSLMISRGPNELLYSRVFNIHLPSQEEGLVPGSEFIKITAIGDLLGSSMNNLDHLVRQPSGCGEQNMIGLVPNIFVMKYLTATGQERPDIANKATGYMQTGYQRELSYKRSDGSFSAFGYYDPSGSTWLTAFVVRSFDQARPFITIDTNVLDRAVGFLIRYQNDDGSFSEPGRVIHSDMMGGASDGVGLTAYILTALLQVQDTVTAELDEAIEKAQTYLESSLYVINEDPYLMSVITYALHLADSDMKDDAYTLLTTMATESGGMRYWTESDEDEEEEEDQYRPWLSYHNTRSVDIEMTGYALLTAVLRGDQSASILISKWLMKKRNSFGGYYSTQDTVVGLNSLAEFAAAMYQDQDEQHLELEVLINNVEYQFDTITQSNSDVLQTIDVPNSANRITISARGAGVAVLQMTVDYHMTEVETSNDVHLEVSSTSLNPDTVSVDVCVRWLNNLTACGMSMVTVQSLSGYDFDTTNMISTYQDSGLKRVDRSGRNVNLYLDEFSQDQLCFEMTQYRFADVSNLQDAVVSAYCYYSPDKQQVGFYNTDNANLVEACVICPSCCEGAEEIDSELFEDDRNFDSGEDVARDNINDVNSLAVEMCITCGVAAILANVVLVTLALLLTML